PHMCAVGGDVLALVHDDRCHAVNGSGRAPRGLRLDVARDGMPVTGPHSITVPGAVSAWQLLCDRWGRRSLGAALQPAAEAAAAGVAVAGSLARAIAGHASQLAADRGMAAIFLSKGSPLEEGGQLLQPALAATLTRLAENGAGELYSGRVGSWLVQGLRALGCHLSESDLAEHETDVGDALLGGFRGHEVATVGPNSQGFVLLQILAALELLDAPDPLGGDAPTLAALFRGTAADRDRYLADPEHAGVPIGELLSTRHVADLAASALSAAGQAGGPRPDRRASGDTVAVVAADGSGLAVSLIQSIFHSFGSGILEPRTGIICHNRGACFSSDPASPNAPAPGKRPMHTLMPVVVRRADRLAWVNGTMGGRAQPQIHAQILLRLLSGASPADAVGAPRFVVGDLAGERPGVDTFVEADARDAQGAFASAGMGILVGGRLDESTGHAHVIASSGGSFVATSDPRSDGAAVTDGPPAAGAGSGT
ncbi:MAG: gamma-glutamyltransferase, partial [Gaiellales bacterium]